MIELVIDQRRRDLGGFEVGRVLPSAKRRMVGPFVFFDHMGPIDFAPGIPRSVDVRPHPHIGLSTVTYLFDGEIMHRDSVGSEQPIRPGEVNWMTAGRGITHSERFERARREGGRMHGIQAWVALPRELEEIEPAFAHHEASRPADLRRRRPLGAARSPAPRSARTPTSGRIRRCSTCTGTSPPARGRSSAPNIPSVRPTSPPARSRSRAQRFDAGKMLVFAPGEPVMFTATVPAIVMLLGGEPLGERFIEWNFVSSSKERIEQAKADWRAGRMKLPVDDSDEFVPLPGDPMPQTNPAAGTR